MKLQYFAVTIPGLEPFLRQELLALGIESKPPLSTSLTGEPREEAGGLEFEGSTTDLYRVNLHVRTANRVLVRLGDFYAAAFSELHKKASRLPWEEYLHPRQPIALRVTCHKSKLYHSDGVAQRVANAISDRLGKITPVAKFDEAIRPLPQLVVVRLVNDRCTISIDTSGMLLHRRGYRLETAKAPLRETLAAGLVLAAEWDGSAPLIDPFCGSGTIAIEAAMIARRIAPGKKRRFAFMDWPGFPSSQWQTQLAEAAALERPLPGVIQASDRDSGAIRISQSNAERAEVLENIQFSCQAFSAIEPPEGPGWVVTNPPYGVRVSHGNDLRNLYSQLGNVLRAKCPGWHTGVLGVNDILVGHTLLKYDHTLALMNGGIPVKFYMGRV
jgi:putative N6-adenine-specific DNA methylase